MVCDALDVIKNLKMFPNSTCDYIENGAWSDMLHVTHSFVTQITTSEWKQASLATRTPRRRSLSIDKTVIACICPRACERGI